MHASRWKAGSSFCAQADPNLLRHQKLCGILNLRQSPVTSILAPQSKTAAVVKRSGSCVCQVPIVFALNKIDLPEHSWRRLERSLKTRVQVVFCGSVRCVRSGSDLNAECVGMAKGRKRRLLQWKLAGSRLCFPVRAAGSAFEIRPSEDARLTGRCPFLQIGCPNACRRAVDQLYFFRVVVS